MGRYQIEFGPMGLRGLCQKGESLLACGQHLGLELAGDCGGKGKCKACKVQVIAGEVSSPTSIEHEVFSSQDLENGWRLACQTYPRSDCRLIVPKETLAGPQRLQVEGLDIKVDIKAPVRAYDVELQPSSLSNSRADCESLLEEIRRAGNGACKFIDIEVIRHLSTELRTWRQRSRCHKPFRHKGAGHGRGPWVNQNSRLSGRSEERSDLGRKRDCKSPNQLWRRHY